MASLIQTGGGSSTPNGAANLVYATPNGAPGNASLRALVGIDLPSLTTLAVTSLTGDSLLYSNSASQGAVTLTLNTQAANKVLAGPTNGAAANPTFRVLVGADLPAPSSSTLGGVQSAAAVAHQWIDSISTAGVPHLSQPSISDCTSGALASGTTATTQAVQDNSTKVATTAYVDAEIAQVTTTGQGRWLSGPPDGSNAQYNTNALTSGVANRVYAIQVVLKQVLKVTTMSIASGATSAAAAIDFGFYNMAGTKLVNTGGITINATSTVFTATVTPVTLQPGVYWFAWTGNHTIGGFNGWQTLLNAGLFSAATPAFMIHGANTATLGVLPATLGALTTDAFTVSIPTVCIAP